MENLIRIKFDPRRGGANADDFLRPRILIYNWPAEEIDIWSSDDGGQSWDKLDDTDFRASFEPATGRLYVELLFDITDTLLLAFFNPGGNIVGAGYTLTTYGKVSLGWCVEGSACGPIPAGWCNGSLAVSVIPCGSAIQGAWPKNIPIGHKVKYPNMTKVPVGHTLASPKDADTGIGFNIGTVALFAVTPGVTILGLSEFAADFLVVDESTADALCTEYAWKKQKAVTLNGTTPEELD